MSDNSKVPVQSIDKQVARKTFQVWLKWLVGDEGGQSPPVCPVSDITSSMFAIALYTGIGMGFTEHYNVTPEFTQRIRAMIDLSPPTAS